MAAEARGDRKLYITVQLAGGQDDSFHARKAIKRSVGTEPAGLWTRMLLEDSDNSWLIACARRHPSIRKGESDYCLVLVRRRAVVRYIHCPPRFLLTLVFAPCFHAVWWWLRYSSYSKRVSPTPKAFASPSRYGQYLCCNEARWIIYRRRPAG